MASAPRTFDAMGREECLALLGGGAQIGRAVFTVRALPAIVPVTFGLHEGSVVIRTGADSRLASAADGQVIAFEVDELDVTTRTGWSVVVTGVATVVHDPAHRARLHALVEPWAPGEHEVYLRLPLTMVSGRRIADDSAAASLAPARNGRVITSE